MKLGKLRTVDIRSVWPDEARDFTPWLLANTDELSQALGLDLDLHRAEHAVGNYSLDLIGTIAESEEVVIVENQLEQSDHRHLGQLMTYAGGTNASYIIWISTNFREEHLSAVRWLNDGTVEGIRFFAVEVSAVQIDDSIAAPHFTVVAQPNEWQKQTRAKANDAIIGERGQQQKEFWNLYLQRIREAHPDWTNAKNGQPQNWYALSTGISSISFTSFFSKGGELVARLAFTSSDGELNQDRFERFENRRQNIEALFGHELEWDDSRKHCSISVRTPGAFGDSADWEQQIRWFIMQHERFREAFGQVRAQL
ncbi:uncharacterized protein DUF4268 [Microbacteriaceae bacterium MWH-Ta3]|nr:uncharacterized protein DUF4268 [Microbacteriaceae bacterium MWH-Ta3]